jgi:hypothetical protein
MGMNVSTFGVFHAHYGCLKECMEVVWLWRDVGGKEPGAPFSEVREQIFIITAYVNAN